MTTDAVPRQADHSASAHQPPATIRATGIVVALLVVLAIITIAFGLPATRSEPHNVPFGAAGPPAANGQVGDLLERAAPGAFEVTTYQDEAALRAAISARDVYGGIALGPQPTMFIATGASPAVAGLLSQVGEGVSQQTGSPLRTEDLAPPTADDPRGVGLSAATLPLTLAALLPAAALVLALRREIWTRLATMAVFAPLAGWTIAALLRYVFGSIDQNFWGVTAGLTLGILAAGLAILGLGSLFGRPGLAIGAVLAVLVGNPLSGLNSAPELLPSGWGAFGQLLPQGANATLLRSTAFFDGAGATTAILVLVCWAAVGAGLVVIAALRQRRDVADDACLVSNRLES